MNYNFKCMVMSTLVVVTMSYVNITSAQSSTDSSTRISKLTGYDGQGFCSVEQNGTEVIATVNVINITPGSTTTAWLKFDGSTVGRLDGTVADNSGSAVFRRTFSVDSGVSSFLFDVRDHNRQLSTIIDNSDLTAELNQPSNVLTGESIRMGTCSFDNTNAVPDACSSGAAVSSVVLDHGESVCVESAPTSHKKYFYMYIDANTPQVTISLNGGSGDANLYVKSGAWPSITDNDGASTNTGNNETVNIDYPAEGWLYITIDAVFSHSGVNLTGEK